jgi:hypothetical protein
MEWGKWEGRLTTHPSHSRRLQALVRQAGLASEQLEALVALPDDGSGNYEVPAAAAAEERLFSPTFKQRRSFRNSWLLILTMTIPPALTAALVQWAGWSGQSLVAALAAGFVASFLAVLFLSTRLGVAGERGLGRRLLARLEKEGLLPADEHTFYVAFSPSPTNKREK